MDPRPSKHYPPPPTKRKTLLGSIVRFFVYDPFEKKGEFSKLFESVEKKIPAG